MSSRRRSRAMALQLLYGLHYQQQQKAGGALSRPAPAQGREPNRAPDRGAEPINLLRDFIVNFEVEPDVAEFGGDLFLGVCANLAAIDAMIEAYARNWKVARMGLVDLSLLRMACFEMRFAAEKVPPSVVIDEAIELAREYGSTESASFVNGILDPIGRDL